MEDKLEGSCLCSLFPHLSALFELVWQEDCTFNRDLFNTFSSGALWFPGRVPGRYSNLQVPGRSTNLLHLVYHSISSVFRTGRGIQL